MAAAALAPTPPAEPVACAHCGLPVPPGLLVAQSDLQFCCRACETVHAVISRSGLSDYYRLRDADAGRKAASTGKSFSDFDDPAFRELYCRPEPGGLLRTQLYVEGVHCSACVWLVERVSLVVDAPVQATLDIGRSVVELVWDPTKISLGAIARALDALGYCPHPQHGLDEREVRRKEDRRLLARIAVAGASAGNAMLMALAMYSGAFSGMDRDHLELLRWGSLLATLPSVLWSAAIFYRGAVGALRTRTPHMDLPISIGIVTGFVWGAFNTFSGRGDVYFDTVTTLIFLLLIGRWLQRRQQVAARDAADLLYALSPHSARRVEGDGVREVPVQALRPGDVVEVRAGESIPVDGTILQGRSAVDNALLTGESVPEVVAPGEAVHAGCVNLSARVRVRVERSGPQTRVGQLLAQVEEAARRRAPIVAMADRLSGIFVMAVLFAALATLLGWLRVDPALAIDHTVALLVVTCPCALGMATPLAVSAALGKAARAGILLKGGDALERLAKPGLLVFDKTGTLTEGRLELVAFHGDAEAKRLAAAAEADATHPIAAAFRKACESETLPAASAIGHTLGGGLSAQVSGHQVLVGAFEFVTGRVAAVPSWALRRVTEHAARGQTPVVIAIDGQVRAVAAFADPPRADARASLERLRRSGYELAMLSGDHPEVVRALADQLGQPFVFVEGGATPERKLELVQRLVQSRPVFMVGDGVNDAAALSAATFGMAVHGGAEASLAAADAFATRSGLSPLVELVDGARRTLGVVRRGLALSLIYNALGAGLAVAGYLSPLGAALLMPLSSLTVVTNAYRSRTFGARREAS